MKNVEHFGHFGMGRFPLGRKFSWIKKGNQNLDHPRHNFEAMVTLRLTGTSGKVRLTKDCLQCSWASFSIRLPSVPSPFCGVDLADDAEIWSWGMEQNEIGGGFVSSVCHGGFFLADATRRVTRSATKV